MPNPDLRRQIAIDLGRFTTEPIATAARSLFNTLGYQSDRTLAFGSVATFRENYDPEDLLAPSKPDKTWKSIDLVFQLTGEDIAKGSSKQLSLLDPDPADLRKIDSYLFITIDLQPPADAKLRTRTMLCNIARAVNRLFPMPALVVFKEGKFISIAITYRRTSKKDAKKDVVGRKVTLIRDISIANPHPGHVAILEDFALPTLSEFRGRDIRTFADLDAAWRESLSVELLRRRAYRMLADWYFWAREHAQFPPDAPLDADGKPSLHIIRLLTRVIFCWFVKEKTLPDGRPLIPHELFDAPRIRETLKDSSPKACTYYTAVLQNLFFATLNTEMDEKGKPANRRFARKIKEDHMVHTLWRHEEQLRDPAAFTDSLRSVPFLNGGLFECLDDRIEIEGSHLTKEVRVDGFSTDTAKHPRVPNFLFFGEEQPADLSEATGGSRNVVQVAPLLTILNRFVWTITESTPLEEEVALDPDLLGNVFENLLASYNPETGTVARNATGSFYTPDYVVDWMIEQALIPLLIQALPPKTSNAELRVRRLLEWDDPSHDFSEKETALLIETVSKLRALDPACGSGAFPMGLLKKMVRVLGKLDPSNTLWEKRQIALAEQIDSGPAREEALSAISRAFTRNNDDYGRKLYLIENGIYGVDIQPLAVQIAKLRFFITLIVDQPIDPALPNYGILPLPNLETKIVPANTLLGLQRGQLLLGSDEVRRLEGELKAVRHRYFTARRYQDKKSLRKRDRELCKKLAKALVESGECSPSDAARLVEWNPYNTNTHAGFFDPGWMFGLEGEGGKFDLVVGNPPYVRQEELKNVSVQDSAGRARPLKEVLKEQYECFTGTADLYVYFIERSLQLLRLGGILSFITSNKYFRAAYGERLRAYLLYATRPRVLLDFGDSPLFTAIAYPCILVVQKTRAVEKGQLPKPEEFQSETRFRQLISDEAAEAGVRVFPWMPGPPLRDFPAVFEEESFTVMQGELRPVSWQLNPRGKRTMLARLVEVGRPLSEWTNGRIFNGIKTGLNDAFVVDSDTKEQLIRDHESSKEVLRPFLRGRDVKRWGVKFAEQWLLYLPWHFPLHRDATITSASRKAEAEFEKLYPAVHAHLNAFKLELSKRDKAETGIRYEWYALARPRPEAMDHFNAPKVVVPAIEDGVDYAPDLTGFLSNDKTSIFIPPSVPYALSILNSPISWWIARQTFPSKQGGFFEFKPTFFSKLPIPAASPEERQWCERLAEALIFLHRPDVAQAASPVSLMAAWFEQWLNGLVYELFFRDELHARHLRLFEETAKSDNAPPALALLGDDTAKLVALRVCFERTYDVNHPLRSMLFSLRSLEPIRIIEGEA